jgi:hypothetical protein
LIKQIITHKKAMIAIAWTMQPKGQIRSKFGDVFQIAATNPGEEPIKKSKNCKCSACADLVIAASSWLRDQ